MTTRVSGLLLAVLALGCTEEGYKTTDLSTRLVVTPPYRGVEPPSAPIQYEATIGGAPVAVTWESSDTDVATVSATGAVSVVDYGFTAITATLTSNPSRMKSASLTVKPAGNPLVSGAPKTGIEGDIGDYILYHIFVPVGATNLTVALSGGTGDFDLHVRFGVPPTLATFDCRPYALGNNETCIFANPATGFWFILLDVYDDAAGASLTATVTVP